MRKNMIIGMAAAAMLACVAGTAQAAPLGNAFTYQGEVANGGVPATGPVDLRFRVYDASAGGVLVGAPNQIVVLNQALVDGRFTTELDFGAAVHNGDDRWLEIDVRPAGGGAYTTLAPRQRLAATPNARFAVNASLATDSSALGGQGGAFYRNASNMNAGTLPNARLGGTYGSSLNFSNVANVFVGDGSGLTGINATNIGSGTISDARLSSNVALLNRNPQVFTGTNTFNANARVNGFFGVNTATPIGSAITVVSGTAGAGQYTGMYVNGTDAQSWPFIGYATANGPRAWTYWNGQTGNWGLYNSGEHMTVQSDGDVGLGTTTPLTSLHVFQAGGAPEVRLEGAPNTGVSTISLVETFGTDYRGGRIRYNAATNDFTIGTLNTGTTVVDAIRLDRGSAQTNLLGNLSVAGLVNSSLTFATDTQSINFAAADATSTPMITMFPTAGSAERNVIGHSPAFPGWGMYYNDPADTFIFKTAATAVPSLFLPLNGANNVGFGTATPTSEFHLARTGANTFKIESGANQNITIDFFENLGSGNGARLSYTGAGANQFIIGTVNNGVPTDAIRINRGSPNIQIVGTFTAAAKFFEIDHPMDPENKIMKHACIESDEYKNVYDGTIVTDNLGYATITLPAWFESLNEKFRYQLTIIDEGDVAGDLVSARVVRKVANGEFAIKTSVPNVEVSWQITGVRKDAWAKANPIQVETDKVGEFKGTYIRPEAYGLPASKGDSVIYQRGQRPITGVVEQRVDQQALPVEAQH